MLNFVKKIFNSIFCKKEKVKDEWQKDIIIWKSSGVDKYQDYDNRIWVEQRLFNKKRNRTQTGRIILVASSTKCHKNWANWYYYAAKNRCTFIEGNLQDLFKLQDHWHIYLRAFLYNNDGENMKLLVEKYNPRDYKIL